MPGRKFSGGSYRYGFNGKENDNEVYGIANLQDYGFRMYDPRIARFPSVDPLTKKYPELTPYQFASNSPIQNIDIDGLEGGWAGFGQHVPKKEWDDFHSGINDGYKKGTPVVAIAVVDVFITRGWLSRTFLLSQGLGLIEHNRGKTFEEKAAQDARFKENATDFAINVSGGILASKGIKVVGAFIQEAKSILKTTYSYGESTVTTQVGKNAVEIGRGGIGTGGYLELEIDVKRGIDNARVAHGETVFDELYKSAQANANTSINGLRGRWFSGKMGDNLSTFNTLILEKVNKGVMTLEEAALQTFTGKMAKKSGFTKVASIVGEQNQDGTYKFVNNILFTKK